MNQTRLAILGLSGGLLGLAALLVLPFIEFLLLAVLLAYPLRPLQRRFEGTFGPRLTAGGLVLAATTGIILPVLWLLRVIVDEVTAFLDDARSGDIDLTDLESSIADLTGEQVDVLDWIQGLPQETNIGTVDGALGVFQTVTNLLIGLGLTVFLLYYFLKDADRFNRWLRATTPLPDRIYDDLRTELDDVIWAVIASHVLIAVAQGVVAGLGLLVLGVPNPVFWTIVMVFLAVLPIIGSFLVWGPAALYLFSIGQSLAGVTLLVYGAIVVSFSDDFLRPIIIDRYTTTCLNPSAIIVGILGGIYLLGFIGIFFGPVIIGSLRAVLDVYRREYIDEGPGRPVETDTTVTGDETVSEGNPPSDGGQPSSAGGE